MLLVLLALIHFASFGSYGVLFSHVTKYETESVELPCFTSLNEQVEWKVISPLQNYILGYERRIYSMAGMQRGFERTGRYSVSAGSGFYNLTIRNLNISESGEYVCIDNLGAGDRSSTHLFVNVNVSSLGSSSSLQVTEKDDITLPCRRNLGGPIRWLYIKSNIAPQDVIFNGVSIESKYVSRITSQVNKHSGDYNLLFHDVRINQSGLYLCVEDWGVIYRHPIQLYVLVNISKITPDLELLIVNGNSTTLQCPTSISSVNRSVAWYYAKSRIAPQVVLFHWNLVDSMNVGRVHVHYSCQDYSLSLLNLQTNESGWYICVDGNNFNSYMVNVHDDVSNLQSYYQLLVTEGDNIDLPCRASLDGAVRWYHAKSQETPHNVIFNEDSLYSNYTYIKSAHSNLGFRDYNLTLDNVQINQYGWYICVDDSNSHPYMLDVLVTNPNIQSNQTLIVYHGSDITLQCRANFSGPVRWHYAKSISTPQLLFNGYSVSSKYIGKITVKHDQNLILTNVQINDSGWYFCVRDVSFHHILLNVHESHVDEPLKLSMGVIIGLTVSLPAAVALVIVAAVLLYRRKKHKLKGRRDIQRNELACLRDKDVPMNLNPTMETKSTHVIPGHVTVTGVTSLMEELFVSRDQEEKEELLIEVYSTETFELKRKLNVKWIRNVDLWRNVMTASEKKNCIYVCDLREQFVCKVNLNEVDEQVKWRVDSKPMGLSVNKEGNVIVTCYDDTIKEYTPSGSLVRLVRLQSEVRYPLHSVELSNGHYAVCHREPVNGVSVVDREGRVVSTYRNDRQSNTQPLDVPYSIAVTADDCILVADRDNNRIIILDSSLSRSRDIYDVVQPICVHFDESRDRLFVAEFSGRVVVLDNVFNIYH